MVKRKIKNKPFGNKPLKKVSKLSKPEYKINKTKRGFNFKQTYRDSYKFLSESKDYIFFTLIVFFVATLIGFIFPYFGETFIKKWVEQLLKQTEGFGFWQFVWFIFQNNSSVALISILSGFFFSIFPFFTLLFNGYIIGLVIRMSVDASNFFELWRLFPHGVFELPAVLISIALGLRFGSFVFSDKPWKKFKYLLANSLQVLIFIILPLLILAALIEAGLIILLK